MKLLTKIKFLASCTITLFITVSCDRYLQIDPPNDKIETSSVFADSTTTDLVMNGMYADLVISTTGLVATQNKWAGLFTDELGYSQASELILQFSNNNVQADNSNLNALWVDIYKHVYQANSLIEGVNNSQGISKKAKEMFIGEAKFLRAFLLFYAVSTWGQIPLTLTTDYRLNAKLPGSPADIVFPFLIADLEDAYQALPSEYKVQNRVRPNKWAAATLLSRVYLYTGNWNSAEAIASEVINSDDYKLGKLSEVFLKDSEETIWQLFPSTLLASYNTYDGLNFIPLSFTDSALPGYLITSGLYESFEPEDGRKNTWIGVKMINEIPYNFPYKYKVRTNSAKSEYTVVFRFAELLLIRSEARMRQENLFGALEDVNAVRIRAGLGTLQSTLSKGEVLLAIENERRHEFFAEWGHRFFDLKRTGRLDEVMSGSKGNLWQNTDKVWPIPLNQLLTNPFLSQNEGY